MTDKEINDAIEQIVRSAADAGHDLVVVSHLGAESVSGLSRDGRLMGYTMNDVVALALVKILKSRGVAYFDSLPALLAHAQKLRQAAGH